MITYTQPCPVVGCTTTLEGEIEHPTTVRIEARNRFGDPVPLPTVPVHWAPDSMAHIEGPHA